MLTDFTKNEKLSIIIYNNGDNPLIMRKKDFEMSDFKSMLSEKCKILEVSVDKIFEIKKILQINDITDD